MARGKTIMALIENEKVLKSTFQKRKKGLIKKVEELATLCDIIACVVIYSPVIGGRPPEIFTWPEEQDKVLAAIRMYKDKMNHYRKTADFCNYWKDRRRLEYSDVSEQQLGNVALSGGGFYETRRDIPAEVAMEYLKWVEARIRAVEERIEVVKNASGLMYGNGTDQFQNRMFGDNMVALPVNQVDGFSGFGYGPFEDSARFDAHRDAQTLCGSFGFNNPNPLYINSVPNGIQFQQSIEPNAITVYQQNLNQMSLCDPYVTGMEQGNIMDNWNRHCHQQQQLQQYGENMQCMSNVTQPQPQPLMSGIPDNMLRICPYGDDWSSPDAGSSNYSSTSSNKFQKSALDDPLEYFLNMADLDDDFKALEDLAGGTIPSQYGI